MISKKVAMLGTWGVGKTSLVRQFVHSAFEDKYLSTLGVKVDKKVVAIENQEVNLMLWDIAGSEDHFSVPIHYVKGSAGYLLVVDGTRRETLEGAVDLVNKIETEIGKLPFVVALNKTDLECEMSLEDIEAGFGEFNAEWFETSAKTGKNLEALFLELTKKMIQ